MLEEKRKREHEDFEKEKQRMAKVRRPAPRSVSRAA